MTTCAPRSTASAVRAVIHWRTRGWTIAFKRALAASSLKTRSPSRLRSIRPSRTYCRPNASTIASNPSVPGAYTACVASSASTTVAPRSANMAATVDLPDPTPPVSPISFNFQWMADEEKFDAVVVGAGPAGTAAAITMAKAGLQVALLERGAKPGSKNVMGGILYNRYLEKIVGEDWRQAPLERPIIEERRWLMTPEAAIGLDYKNLRNREHPHSYSVLRARFDPWFAERAEKAGAMVVPETVVDRLIVRGGRVVGVGTGRGDDLYADVTIVCEGIGLGSGLLEKTVIDGRPLRRKLRPNEVAMAVKEIMQLDPRSE